MPNQDFYSLGRLRTGLLKFGIGKAINGGLGFAILLLLAGSLRAEEYGAYLILLSAGQLASAISLVGLNAVSSLYVPRFRMGAGTRRLLRFCAALFGFRAVLLVLAAVLLLLFAGPLTAFFGVPDRASSINLLAVAIFLTGLGGFLRIGVLEPLLLQGYAQSVWSVRNISFFCFLLVGLHVLSDNPSVDDVLRAEIAAAIASLTAAVWCLFAYWRKHDPSDGDQDKWVAPPIAAMVRTGIYDHFSYLMRLTGNPQAILLVAGRMLGPEATAGFGFVFTLSQQIKQYLPAEVIAPVVRPKLVAQFAQDKSFAALNERSSTLYKASLFVLGPVIAIFLTSGTDVLNLLSADRYGGEALVMLVLLLTLIPAAHNIVLWGVMITIERMDIFAKGAFTSLLTVPLAILFIALGAGTLGLALAILITVVLYNLVIVRSLRSAKFTYRMDLRGAAMITIAVLAASVAILLVPGTPAASLLHLAGLVLLGGVAFLAVCFVTKPFSSEERELFNRLAQRRVFVW